MKDEEVEKIIRSNMNLQMNLAGIRADFEEKLQRPWVGLTDGEIKKLSDDCVGVRDETEFIRAIEAKLKEKNNGT